MGKSDLYDRSRSYDVLLEHMLKQYKLSDDEARERTQYMVVYASGLAGIGKTLFGEQALSRLIKLSDCEPSFNRLLSKSNYILVEMNGKGDCFSRLDLATKLPGHRMNLRVLARASKMTYQMLDELVVEPTNLELQNGILQDMRNKKELIEVSNVLEKYFKTGVIPSLEKIFAAMAKDFRSANGDPNETMGIFIHVDEHQLLFEKIKDVFKYDDSLALDAHKEFLYPLLQISISGWCRRNNVYIFPFFTGTNHYTLSDLVKETKHRKVHIPLDGLTLNSSRAIISNKIPNNTFIHSSWFNKQQKYNELAPIDIFSSEIMGIPRLITNAWEILGKQLESEYSRFNLTQLLRKTSQWDRIYGLPIEPTKEALLAIFVGMYLSKNQLMKLNHGSLTSCTILQYLPGNSDDSRIAMSAALLSRAANVENVEKFPIAFGSILKLEENLLYPKNWEKVVAERIGAVISLKQYFKKQFKLSDLLGPMFVDLTRDDGTASSEMFSKLLKMSSIPIDEYYYPYEKHFFVNNSTTKNIEALPATMRDFIESSIGESSFTQQSLEHVVVHLEEEKSGNNPVADVVVRCTRVTGDTLIAFVSVKGPQQVGSTSSHKLEMNQITRDIEQVAKFVSPFIHCSLVYVISRLQADEDIKEYKSIVANAKRILMEKNPECRKIAVALVHDMNYFVPSIAHRFAYEIDNKEQQL